MNTEPKASIIMSVYNDADFLSESIESILNQTYKNFEFLIVDDKSTDSSFSILKHYEQLDPRIKVYSHNENKGLPYSLNELISYSHGDLIVRMDSDDIALNNRLEREIQQFKNDENVDMVFSDTLLITRDGKNLCKSWRPKSIKTICNSLGFNNYIPHPTVVLKKSIFVENKYNEKCLRGQDTELWRRLIKKKINIRYLPEILLKYRLNPRSTDANSFYCETCIANHAKIKGFLFLWKIKNLKIKLKMILKMFIPFFMMRLHNQLLGRI